MQILRITYAIIVHVHVQVLRITYAIIVRDLFRSCVLHAHHLSMTCPKAACYMRNVCVSLVRLLYKLYTAVVCVYEILHKTTGPYSEYTCKPVCHPAADRLKIMLHI